MPPVPQSPPPLEHLAAAEPWVLDIDVELAHASSGGAIVRAGDLFSSGTISGAEPGTYGCLLELSWDGRDPIPLSDGTERRYLEDGDTVVIRGRGNRDGSLISFGEVSGRIDPAGG